MFVRKEDFSGRSVDVNRNFEIFKKLSFLIKFKFA